jgi:hypothetical protein
MGETERPYLIDERGEFAGRRFRIRGKSLRRLVCETVAMCEIPERIVPAVDDRSCPSLGEPVAV